VGTQDHSVVMGYPVNVASRLQNATKELNNEFIVSSDIYNLLIDPPALTSQSIFVKGISDPLTVYLMGNPYQQANERPQVRHKI
jgi:adenylate cyclase